MNGVDGVPITFTGESKDPDPDRSRARACGLRLLEASRAYEDVTFEAEAGALAMVVALVGRARRMLRAAYRLADAGEELEAASIRRPMVEYMLRVRWLVEGDVDANVMIWRWEDARVRLLGDQNVRRDKKAPVLGMPADDRVRTELLKNELAERLRERGIDKPRMPGVEELVGDDSVIYALYRAESQVGAHPTPLAAEQLLTRTKDGTLRVQDGQVEREEIVQVDTYGLCASTLLGLLVAVEAVLPSPLMDPRCLEAINAELASPRSFGSGAVDPDGSAGRVAVDSRAMAFSTGGWK